MIILKGRKHNNKWGRVSKRKSPRNPDPKSPNNPTISNQVLRKEGDLLNLPNQIRLVLLKMSSFWMAGSTTRDRAIYWSFWLNNRNWGQSLPAENQFPSELGLPLKQVSRGLRTKKTRWSNSKLLRSRKSCRITELSMKFVFKFKFYL